MSLDTVLARARERAPVRLVAGQHQTKCPAHDDQHASLSLSTGDDGKVLVNCFGGCRYEAVRDAYGLVDADFFPRESRPARRAKAHTTAKPSEVEDQGCTVEAYATAKRLSVDVLVELGLTDTRKNGHFAIRIPYKDVDGRETDIRYRHRLTKDPDGQDHRFTWITGAKPGLYGLWQLSRWRSRPGASITLTEGESDCHTLWLHDVPAVGVPGADTWKDEWATHLDGFDPVYVVIEPDHGGQVLRAALSTSPLRDRLRLVDLSPIKDVSDCYLQDPAAFLTRWQTALEAAVPVAIAEQHQVEDERTRLWTECRDLAEAPDILKVFRTSVHAHGLAGEDRVASLVLLAVVSRFLMAPVSIVLKGPSSAGKNYTVEHVLQHVPPEAFYTLSGLSDHALAYSSEPLQHRMLVIYEAAALTSDFATYLLRSLLSEHRIRYETVQKIDGKLQAVLIEREGPTGLILTTTEVALHQENETRLLSLPIDDSPEQTKRILQTLADLQGTTPPDLTPWHALDRWLARGEHRVVIPYARVLADLIPPVAIRLRRDFPMLMNLVSAHAVLHQASRPRDGEGRIVASLEDYTAIRALLEDVFATQIEATVSEITEDTVEAVRVLTLKEGATASITQVAHYLKLDPSTASRRVKTALAGNYLVNEESRDGRPAKLVLGEPLPDEQAILPAVDQVAATLAEAMHAGPHAIEADKPDTTGDLCARAGLAPGSTEEQEPAWVTEPEPVETAPVQDPPGAVRV